MFTAAAHVSSLALVSRSRDADLLCALLARTPVRTVRGSSSSGAPAVRSLLRHLRRGGTVIMALDGPRGPAGVAKPGTAWLARTAGVPILRCEFEPGAHFSLHDWSRLRVPLPGSCLHLHTTSFEP